MRTSTTARRALHVRLAAVVSLGAIAVLAGCLGPNLPPVASFTASSLAGYATLSVTFDARDSADAEGAIASYDWDFGDGAKAVGDQVSHVFVNAGDYVVTLTVTDEDGAIDRLQKTLTVLAPPLPPPSTGGGTCG